MKQAVAVLRNSFRIVSLRRRLDCLGRPRRPRAHERLWLASPSPWWARWRDTPCRLRRIWASLSARQLRVRYELRRRWFRAFKSGSRDCQLCRSLAIQVAQWAARLRVRRKPARNDPAAHDQRLMFRKQLHPGSRDRYYHLHLPPRIADDRPRPLVMLLHGCRQTDAQIRHIANLDALADQFGFIAVYPWVTAYSGLRTRNCWGWWYRNEIRAGAGEVEDLWRIIEQVSDAYPVDPSRIHVAGLSSGGGMAVAMMMAHARRIASGAVVAGVPYGEGPGAVNLPPRERGVFKPIDAVSAAMNEAMGRQRRPVPVFIAHSHDDRTVDIQAAENIRDSWARTFHINLRRRSVRRGVIHDTPWEHCRYRDVDRRSVIETLYLRGCGHGWYGGRPGRYSFPDAPNLSRMMWEFFRAHPL